MTPELVKCLESYITTDNDHWNRFAVQVLCETMKDGLFENPDLPLQLISAGENQFVQEHIKPLQVVREFFSELDKKELTSGQRLFVISWLLKYIKSTSYKDISLWDVEALLEVEKKRLTLALNKDALPIQSIRETLNNAIQGELSNLQVNLNNLEPERRLNMVCKLLRYVRTDDKVILTGSVPEAKK